MKYRVYDTITNRYVTDTYSWILFPDGELFSLCVGGYEKEKGCEVEFSSGELDKHGVEIFEGDIVSMPAWQGGKWNTPVYFEDGKFAVNGSNSVFKDLKSQAYEVVGTIHDSGIVVNKRLEK